MERVVHIAKNYEEASDWDAKQYFNMTTEESQQAAKELKNLKI